MFKLFTSTCQKCNTENTLQYFLCLSTTHTYKIASEKYGTQTIHLLEGI